MSSDQSEQPASHEQKSNDGADATSSSRPGQPSQSAQPAVPFTRAAALWSSLTVGFLILIVLLVFITENPESVSLAFFGWHWHLPLGVAILLAAVGGGLLTVLVGAARIYQLRRAAKKFTAGR